MGITVKGAVGPDVLQDGAESALRMGKGAELVVQALHGRYYEQTVRGNMYSVANQAAQATTVALATTYTGLCVYNPLGSRVNLVPNKVKYALTAAPAAAASIGLIGGFSPSAPVTTLTVALTPTNNIIGGPKGVGLALSSGVIVTPTWLATLWDAFTAAAFPAPTLPVDIEGMFIIPPGGFIAFGSLTAVTGFGWMSWEEVPI